MRVCTQSCELDRSGEPVSVAIGTFDGVHVGHQRIILNTVQEARRHQTQSLVITFDRHPASVVAPTRAPALIYTALQKQRAMAALEVDLLWVMTFDREFSQQTGEQFLHSVAREVGPIRSVSVGSHFTFGRHRGGNVALLRSLEGALGFTTFGLDPLLIGAKPMSSTRLREAIRQGHLGTAGEWLGRPYALAGRVVPGDHLGRQLGYPTANLDVQGRVLPPRGVYIARTVVSGDSYLAVLNLGFRPTLKSREPILRVEAHLLDYTGDLYDQELELTLLRKLRDERTFASLEALRAQIARDIAAARA